MVRRLFEINEEPILEIDPLDEAEYINNHKEVQNTYAEIENISDNIETAINDVNTVSRFNENIDDNASLESIKIITSTIKNIKQRLGYRDITFACESQTANISLENLVADIWEKIKAAFIFLYNKMRDFFYKLFDFGKSAELRAKKAYARIKASIENDQFKFAKEDFNKFNFIEFGTSLAYKLNCGDYSAGLSTPNGINVLISAGKELEHYFSNIYYHFVSSTIVDYENLLGKIRIFYSKLMSLEKPDEAVRDNIKNLVKDIEKNLYIQKEAVIRNGLPCHVKIKLDTEVNELGSLRVFYTTEKDKGYEKNDSVFLTIENKHKLLDLAEWFVNISKEFNLLKDKLNPLIEKFNKDITENINEFSRLSYHFDNAILTGKSPTGKVIDKEIIHLYKEYTTIINNLLIEIRKWGSVFFTTPLVVYSNYIHSLSHVERLSELVFKI